MTWTATNIGLQPGGNFSIAQAASADGSVIVGVADTGDFNGHAFWWTQASGMIDLGILSGGSSSIAYAVSADGSKVVGQSDGGSAPLGSTVAVLWTVTAGGASVVTTELGYLGTGNSSVAFGISADGAVIVGSSTVTAGDPFFLPVHPFRRTAGPVMTDLGLLSGNTNGIGQAASSDGSSVFGGSNDVADVPWRWTSGTGVVATPLFSGEVSGAGLATSTNGQRATGFSNTIAGGVEHAFRWDQGTGTTLIGTLSGNQSVGVGMSGDGTIIVGNSGPSGGEQDAFYWTLAGGFVALPPPAGGTVPTAHGISSDGIRPVGHATVGGFAHAVYWTESGPPPGNGLVDIAELWFGNTPGFVDLTVESNRRKFISIAGGAQDLGLTGEAPFTVSPPLYLTDRGTPASFATNNGRGGPFVITGGPLVSADTNPPGSSTSVDVLVAPSSGKGVLGSYIDGKLYAFNATTLTDNGTARKWVRRWRALERGVDAAVSFYFLTITMKTGVQVPAGTNPQVMLRWSDDGGYTWKGNRILAAGKTGQITRKIRFNRLGSTRRFAGSNRIFELSSIDAFSVSIQSAAVDISA